MELSRDQQLALVRSYVQDNFVSAGMCADFYDLDERGQRIPDGSGGWKKNHREDTTDWNDRGKSEQWRKAWADCANKALEAAGRRERINHRSYKRQGVEKIPTIHMGVAATRMERRGIQTDKGKVNRQIAADNKLLKEIKSVERLRKAAEQLSKTEPSKEHEPEH